MKLFTWNSHFLHIYIVVTYTSRWCLITAVICNLHWWSYFIYEIWSVRPADL